MFEHIKLAMIITVYNTTSNIRDVALHCPDMWSLCKERVNLRPILDVDLNRRVTGAGGLIPACRRL